MTSTSPDDAFTQKPNHITGKNLFIGAIGSSFEKPSNRRSMTMLAPTRNPSPSVWRNKTVGYAHTDVDSRTHVEKPLCSSLERNSMTTPTGDRKTRTRTPKQRR